jgi:hypothetical protein
MENSSEKNTTRLEILIAILIAIVSATIATAAWRINAVSSNASDESRRGLLDAIKKQAFTNENWRQVYTEANNAESYATFLAEVNALEASSSASDTAQAANLKQYMLPSMQLLASPLVTDKKYQNEDGTYDLQKRFGVLEAESPDLSSLDPQASFQAADRYFSEQRWLTVATVVLAISLFWLAMAEISGKKVRIPTLVIGAAIYGMGVAGLLIIELVFFILRGGVL